MGSACGRGRSVIVWRHMHANHLMFMAVLLQLLGSGRASYRLPEDAPDGLYMGFVDENGEEQLKYMGKGGNTTHPGVDIGGRGRKLLQLDPPGEADSLSCSGYQMAAIETVVATSALADFFGGGNEFRYTVMYRASSAVAYGCDYSGHSGHSQWATDNTIWADAEDINQVCHGWTWSGYASHDAEQTAFGRLPSTVEIC